ncbi:MAG: Vms1/Ankzf1 family peptidyl-tRNA hydrolase [Candidatus Methanoperedens sp.]|nr:Vms1/Ankzf1 family peptidyl-tRNA hydrolase [Candidatus Methanoperedens sp.]
MLDLFNKEEIKSLKARISQLEEENTKLCLQLEKKDEKAKKTIATKQDVDRELNEAINKISSLQNEIQIQKKETSTELKFRFSENLSRNRFDEMMLLLGGIQSKLSTLITIYLGKDATSADAAQDIVNLIDSSSLHQIEKIESSTGKIIFYDTNRIINIVIIPVFPINRSECFLNRQFNLEPLKVNLEYERILVLNTHAGETLIGIAQADSFIEHEVIRSSVMGKHKQGGWSQKRFQALVEEDIKHHSDKVRALLDTMIAKHTDIQYIIAGGDGKLIKMITEGYNYPVVAKSMDAVLKGNVDQVLREAMSLRCYWI